MYNTFLPTIDYLKIIQIGRREDAHKALQWLRGPEFDIQVEMGQMEAAVQKELSQSSRFLDILHPLTLKPILVAAGLMFFQQMSGINAALFNAASIFYSAGSSLDGLICCVILNVVQVYT